MSEPIAVHTLFLGASIVDANCSLGWNGTSSELNVTLVEDPHGVADGKVYYDGGGNPHIHIGPDFFNPPKLGYPVVFKWGTFSFAGVLKSWQQINSRGGKPTYSVRVTDPSSLLANTQVILKNYDGPTFNIPNLVNLYGFLEHVYGTAAPIDASLKALLSYSPTEYFGGAEISNGGLQWNQARTSLQTLINMAAGDISLGSIANYCGFISLRDGVHKFYVDLSELPVMDDAFRLTGDSTSLLDIVRQVCDYLGREFFTELIIISNGTPTDNLAGHIDSYAHKFIKIRVVNRSIQPDFAKNVDQYVNTPIENRLGVGKIAAIEPDGTAGNTKGIALIEEIPTNALLVGENRHDMWQIDYDGAGNGYTDTIWPYWGVDANNAPIIGSGYNNNHSFTVNLSDWGFSDINRLYFNNQLEMMYTITMQELRDALDGRGTWDSYVSDYHSNLARILKIVPSVSLDMLNHPGILNGKGLKPDDFKATKREVLESVEVLETKFLADKLYGYVVDLATNYFGKKFLVSLPFIAKDSDSDEPYTVKLNFTRADAGWSELPVLGLQATSPHLEFFRQDDGRIVPMFYFHTNSGIVDCSRLSNSEYVYYGDSLSGVYVRGNFEEITFLDPINNTYPRAVVSVDNFVSLMDDTYYNRYQALFAENYLTEDSPLTTAQFQKFFSGLGADTLNYSMERLPLVPTKAAVPIKSETISYGPWYATSQGSIVLGPGGKTEYERNTDLAPWNYGSEALMNNVGRTLVQTKVVQQQIAEEGEVTLAGLPSVSRLGDVLVAGGPEITNINISFAPQGVTTSYQMKSFIPNFGDYGRLQAEQMRFVGQFNNKAQRLFNRTQVALSKEVVGRNKNTLLNVMTRPDRFTRFSSHSFFAGENIEDFTGSGCYRSIAIATDLRKSLQQIAVSGDYINKAGAEATSLFRPYTTRYAASGNLPGFAFPSGIDRGEAFSPDGPAGWNWGGAEIHSNVDYYDKQDAMSQSFAHQGVTLYSGLYDCTRFATPEALPPVKGEGNVPITFTTLNPFMNSGVSFYNFYLGDSKGHDIDLVIRDGIYPVDLNIRAPSGDDYYSIDNWYRAVGLKGPLVLVGWGYDIDGKPVPNLHENDDGSSTTAFFEKDWLRKPHRWKAGPVDLRWDYTRGVWTNPPPYKLVRAVALTDITTDDTYMAKVIDQDMDDSYGPGGNVISSGYISVANPYAFPVLSGMVFLARYNPSRGGVNYSNYDILHCDNPEFYITSSTPASGASVVPQSGVIHRVVEGLSRLVPDYRDYLNKTVYFEEGPPVGGVECVGRFAGFTVVDSVVMPKFRCVSFPPIFRPVRFINGASGQLEDGSYQTITISNWSTYALVEGIKGLVALTKHWYDGVYTWYIVNYDCYNPPVPGW